MNDLQDFRSQLGGLRDATIGVLLWRPSERVIEFIYDICWNFEGLPEYQDLNQA